MLFGIQWTLAVAMADDVAISAHFDELALALAATHRVERFTDADIGHSAEATRALAEMKRTPESFGRSHEALDALDRRIR